eukprot:3031797-Rhodomonas_salina.3
MTSMRDTLASEKRALALELDSARVGQQSFSQGIQGLEAQLAREQARASKAEEEREALRESLTQTQQVASPTLSLPLHPLRQAAQELNQHVRRPGRPGRSGTC